MKLLSSSYQVVVKLLSSSYQVVIKLLSSCYQVLIKLLSSSYLVLIKFLSSINTSSYRWLQLFASTFIHLIDKLFEPGRGVIVSKSRHRISSYYSIIIISTQRYLVYRLSEDLVFIIMITFIFFISMFPRNKHSCSLRKLYSSLLRPS